MSTVTLSPQVLDEDLQIVRVTLATIAGDVRCFSSRAADAIQEALANLDLARREFSGCRRPEADPKTGASALS
jgi:hypothetical protein